MFPRRAVFLTAAVVGALAMGGGEAVAAPVACGETITTDTTLDNDLVDCPNNGIVIGANGVTLDLNGHTIDGDGEPFDDTVAPRGVLQHCPDDELCDVGVASERHNRLTIKGGRIKEFSDGVLTDHARHAHLRRLTVTGNLDAGVLILRSRDVRLRRSTVARNAFLGIAYIRVTRSDVSSTSVLANGVDTDQAGIGLFGSKRGPPSTLLGVTVLGWPGQLVEIEAVASGLISARRRDRESSVYALAPLRTEPTPMYCRIE